MIVAKLATALQMWRLNAKTLYICNKGREGYLSAVEENVQKRKRHVPILYAIYTFHRPSVLISSLSRWSKKSGIFTIYANSMLTWQALGSHFECMRQTFTWHLTYRDQPLYQQDSS
jgi:hypothetical protein